MQQFWNGLSVLFQLSNGDLSFSCHAYSICKVRKPKMTKLGQGAEVRAYSLRKSLLFYPKFNFHDRGQKKAWVI